MGVSAETSVVGELYCPTCEKTFASGDRCPTDNTRLVRISKSGDQLLGRELDGRYTVVEKLGQGGMGTVYRGTQHSVGREVAIKVVTPRLVSEPVVIKRFLREAKLASRLSHPNAVAVLDFGQTEDGLFYLVMELVNGRTLDKVIETDGRLMPARIVRIGAQICDALEGAHQLQIVHRDLKPSNVMIMSTGRDLVKVLDFGLAKSLSPAIATSTMTNAGAILGTPAFMPPELVTGEGADGRADLYSLGCLLHFAAAGELPFAAGSVHELIAAHATEPPRPLPNVPKRLANVVARLLAKSPADRFQTAALAREALEAALDKTAPPDPEPVEVTSSPTLVGWSTPVPGRPSTNMPLVGRASTGELKKRATSPAAGSTMRGASPNAADVSGVEPPRRPSAPARGVHVNPGDEAVVGSQPTLLATADIVIPPMPSSHASRPALGSPMPAPARSSKLGVIGFVAVLLLFGAIITIVAIRGSSSSPGDASPPGTSPTTTSPPPSPAPPAPAAPAPAPSTNAETAPAGSQIEVETPAPPTLHEGAAPVEKPGTKPDKKDDVHHPTGSIRLDPGAF